MRKSKIRKPRKFGVRDEIHQVTFDIDKEALTLKINGYLSLDEANEDITLEPKYIRWLANRLKDVADYIKSKEA